jgi:exonuclease SbcD
MPSPLRILHFSDLHIGVETYSRPAAQADLDRLPPSFAPGVNRAQTYIGLPTRLLDALRAFDELVDAAIAEQADLILFTGDAYRTRDPSQTHQREFARRIARLTAAGVPVLLLTGNHDLPNAQGRATALEIFDTLDVPRVTVASRLGIHVVQTAKGPVQVIAVPWMRRSAVLAQEETRGMTFDEVNEWTQSYLTSSIQRMANQLDPGIPAVLAAHGTVSTARLGSERSMMVGHDYTLLPSALQDQRLDYVALGHVHRHQVLADRPPIVYAGSVHRVDFAEEGEPKGFCLLELDPSKPAGQRLLDWRFRELWSRPFRTIGVAVRSGDPSPTTTVLEAIAKQDTTDAIVRVDVTVPEEVRGLVDVDAVREALRAAHHIAGVNVRVEVGIRQRTRLGAGIAVERLTPLDALRLYLENRQTPAARKEVLLRYAATIIEPPDGTVVAVEEGERIIVRIADPTEMDDIFAVRRRVFVEEQGIDPALEFDGQDGSAVHAVALAGERVIGTGRLLIGPDGRQARIGRMAVLPEYRRHGIGGSILETLEEEARRQGVQRAYLHAQAYVSQFYAAHGYRQQGEPFQEAGIEHVEMWKDLPDE